MNDTEKRDAIDVLKQVGATVNVSLIHVDNLEDHKALTKIERLLNNLISRVGEL